MKFGKKSIGAITAGLSLVMALAPVTPALANSGTQATVATGVTKVLQVNPGSSVTAKFTYTATPTVIKGAKVDGKNTTSTESHEVSATIADIELTADGTEATKTGAITYGTFPHAGTYAWTVKENADTYTGTGEMQYDPETYTLVAVVNNTDNGGTTVAESYLIKGTVEEASGDKVGTATFTNKYTENSNDGQNKPLVVTKKVQGAQGNKGQDFNFTVTFTAPTVLPKDKTAAQVLNEITPSVNGATITDEGTIADAANSTATTRTVKFKAADSKGVTFDGVLVGTTYTVDEETPSDYSATGEVEQAAVLSEDGAEVTVTNTKSATVVTGVIMNNAPFIVMIGAAAAGVVAYGSAKRKLEK